MMFLPRLYARLCARQAGRTLLASRITQNYSQFMRCPEADVPPDFLRQNAGDERLSFCRAGLPARAVAAQRAFRSPRPGGGIYPRAGFLFSAPHPAAGHALAGFGLIADALLATAPDDVRFQFVTRLPALHKLMAARARRRALSVTRRPRCKLMAAHDERRAGAPRTGGPCCWWMSASRMRRCS